MPTFQELNRLANQISPEAIERERADAERIRLEMREKRAAEQREREVYEAYENAVGAIIERRQEPSAVLLSEELGCPQDQAARWLDGYREKSLKNAYLREEAERARGVEAQQRVNEARKHREEAEERLQRFCYASGLSVEDVLSDPDTDKTHPVIAAALHWRKEYTDVWAKYGYWAELSANPIAAQAYTLNAENRREWEKSVVADIADAQRNYRVTCERTRDLTDQLNRIQRQITESREKEHETHRLVLKSHCQHWRVTGSLCDLYPIPPRPGAETDASTS